MAVTLETFKAAFPEFDLDGESGLTEEEIDAHDALVTAKIAEAEAMLDRTVFPSTENADAAISYKAAHLLALSPSGINARLVKDKKGDPRTLYKPTLDTLVKGATCALGRVC